MKEFTAELTLQLQKQLIKFNELYALTKELAQAAERKDQVSMQLLLSMRQEPLAQAKEIDDGIRESLLTLLEEAAIRLSALLNGAEPETPDERSLCEQAAHNRRTLQNITELDEKISRGLGGSRSYYNTYR